jgi:hypothetical protein
MALYASLSFSGGACAGACAGQAKMRTKKKRKRQKTIDILMIDVIRQVR